MELEWIKYSNHSRILQIIDSNTTTNSKREIVRFAEIVVDMLYLIYEPRLYIYSNCACVANLDWRDCYLVGMCCVV